MTAISTGSCSLCGEHAHLRNDGTRRHGCPNAPKVRESKARAGARALRQALAMRERADLAMERAIQAAFPLGTRVTAYYGRKPFVGVVTDHYVGMGTSELVLRNVKTGTVRRGISVRLVESEHWEGAYVVGRKVSE